MTDHVAIFLILHVKHTPLSPTHTSTFHHSRLRLSSHWSARVTCTYSGCLIGCGGEPRDNRSDNEAHGRPTVYTGELRYIMCGRSV